MVGRLVEQQQVGVVDQQPRQRDAGLLAARQLRRRPRPSPPAARPEPGQCLLHALVEVVAAQVVEPLAEAGVLAGLDRRGARDSRARPAATSSRSTSAAPERTARSTLGAAANAWSRLDSWPSIPTRTPLAAWTEPRSGSSAPVDDPQQRRLAGTVGADQADALAARDGTADRIEDDEVADLPAHRVQTQDAHER